MATHTRTGHHGGALERLRRENDFFQRHGFTRTPQLVQWLVTARCPLSCAHCLAPGEAAGGAELTLEEGAQLIDEIAALGVPELLLTGGEPLARADLPELIAHLERRRVAWSLNTAVLPDAPSQAALRRYPPAFVAVSLDGPRAVHDDFRGRAGAYDDALAALRFYATLDGCQVAAGTTVTALNFDALDETFRIAAASGAHSWGVHLPIPEGRARRRRDLLLSRRQLRRLLRFVARRRRWFPVTLADEIGWCGDWEPLVRDGPFRCGAGTAQCVVLPDGEVVPCTTMDAAESAGNVRRRALADLWRDGFGELRRWRPEGRCGDCDAAVACGGGCWLQRRAGTECHRDVWQAPAALRRAAGVALGAALLGVAAPAAGGAPPARPVATAADPRVATAAPTPAGETLPDPLETFVLGWYVSQMKGAPAPAGQPAVATDDPGAAFVRRFVAGDLPLDGTALAAAVRDALDSRHRSLALASVCWRALAERVLDGPGPGSRTVAERTALREALFDIDTTAAAWRRDIYTRRLSPYLERGRRHLLHRFEMSKALRPPPPGVLLARDTDVERWGAPAGRPVGAREPPPPVADTDAATRDAWLTAHPWAGHLQIRLDGPRAAGVVVRSASGERAVDGATAVGPFEVVVTPKRGRGDVPATLSSDERSVAVSLPRGVELTWPDLVRLADDQGGDALAAAVDATLGSRDRPAYDALPPTEPLLLPALRRRAAADAAARERERLAPWFADFWLF